MFTKCSHSGNYPHQGICNWDLYDLVLNHKIIYNRIDLFATELFKFSRRPGLRRPSIRLISSSIKRIRLGDKNTMQLETLGKPTSLQLGAPGEAERIYTISEAMRLKVDAGLSDRNLFKVLKSIRYILGGRSLPSGIKAALFQHKNMFSDLFAVKKSQWNLPAVWGCHTLLFTASTLSLS